MEALPVIDAEKLAAFVGGRAEYERAFPLVFRRIGDAVEVRLKAKFPGIRAVVGLDALFEARALLPAFGDAPPIDWVAFAFADGPMWDAHVGVVWNLTAWPVTFRVGFHLGQDLRAQAGRFTGLPWRDLVGLDPQFCDLPEVKEVQWVDPARQPDLGALQKDVRDIVERVVRYYEAAAPHVAALRKG